MLSIDEIQFKRFNIFNRFYGNDYKLNNEYNDIINIIDTFLYERYIKQTLPIYAKLPVHPHLIPRKLRSFLSRQLLCNVTKKKEDYDDCFSVFPQQFLVDKLRDFVKNCVEKDINKKIKQKAIWPENKRFAIIATHDVDTDYIFKYKWVLKRFIDIEHKHNIKSVWFIVAKRFKLNHLILSDLQKKGHEIGFHGDKHDYKFAFSSKEEIMGRLEYCEDFLQKYNVKGFRSPVFLRTYNMFKCLQRFVEYDMSIHDVTINPLTKQKEGCMSVFPFFIDNLLEIPTTIPEDTFLKAFGYSTEEIIDIQAKKLEQIKEKGGVVNILTHPEPQISANKQGYKIYDALLEKCYQEKEEAWITLPNKLNTYWRKRDRAIQTKHK